MPMEKYDTVMVIEKKSGIFVENHELDGCRNHEVETIPSGKTNTKMHCSQNLRSQWNNAQIPFGKKSFVR